MTTIHIMWAGLAVLAVIGAVVVAAFVRAWRREDISEKRRDEETVALYAEWKKPEEIASEPPWWLAGQVAHEDEPAEPAELPEAQDDPGPLYTWQTGEFKAADLALALAAGLPDAEPADGTP